MLYIDWTSSQLKAMCYLSSTASGKSYSPSFPPPKMQGKTKTGCVQLKTLFRCCVQCCCWFSKSFVFQCQARLSSLNFPLPFWFSNLCDLTSLHYLLCYSCTVSQFTTVFIAAQPFESLFGYDVGFWTTICHNLVLYNHNQWIKDIYSRFNGCVSIVSP